MACLFFCRFYTIIYVASTKSPAHFRNMLQSRRKAARTKSLLYKCPTLHIGNFRFTKSNDENNWKEITLKPNETYWGGEPAGKIITNYLVPEIFTLFTDETRNNLIKNYRLVPENTGNIKAYKKFWKGQATFNETVVHPLLAYADLMNTGNSRCMETAKMIYDRYFKENI